MEDESKLVADCYAKGERTGMLRFQRLRARALLPLLTLLSRLQITANHITLLSFLSGMSFCLVWWLSHSWALLCLLLHVLLDGLDGPVARFQGTASARGSLTDSMCDQLVVTASMICLIHDQRVAIVPGTIYIFTYAMVVAFAMVRNALEDPYSWVMRPRFLVFAWLALDLWFLQRVGWDNTLDYFLWICNVPLTIKMGTGFFAIRRTLDGK